MYLKCKDISLVSDGLNSYEQVMQCNFESKKNALILSEIIYVKTSNFDDMNK